MPPKLLVATTNPGKAKEIIALLSELPVECVALGDLDPIPEASEEGKSFERIARAKAVHYGRHTKLPTVAEDAGLEIPVLDGWPGVESARVASTDEERIAKVVERVKAANGMFHEAAFVSVAAFYDPISGKVETFRGVCQGNLVTEPRGKNGFGYDPLFLHPGYGKTLAEVSVEEKNLVSHRGQSIRALVRRLKEYDWGKEAPEEDPAASEVDTDR